jgi:hypothetical protein
MKMSNAVLGAGATLQISTVGSPATYVTIAEVLRCGPIGSTAPEVDVTNLGSTSKEYIAGLPDGNTVEFEFNWTKTTQQADLRDSVGETRGFRMIWPDGSPSTQATFSMAILQFDINETTPESQITARASGRITGDITWA